LTLSKIKLYIATRHREAGAQLGLFSRSLPDVQTILQSRQQNNCRKCVALFSLNNQTI